MKRATRSEILQGRYYTYFNPRPREEGDFRVILKRLCNSLYFNPRPREEGDCITKGFRIFMCHFNPRPREEGDLVSSCIYCHYL